MMDQEKLNITILQCGKETKSYVTNVNCESSDNSGQDRDPSLGTVA